MNVNFKAIYVLEINAQELRVVGLALSGRLKDSADIEAARRLNVALAEQRAAHIADMHGKAQRVLEHTKAGTALEGAASDT